MSVEAPLQSVDMASVSMGPVESLPADFFDGTVAVDRGLVGGPETGYGTLVDIMSEGYAIQRKPEALATILMPASSAEEVLEAVVEPSDSDEQSHDGPRFVPYNLAAIAEQEGQDSTLVTGVTLVSEQGIIRPMLAETDRSDAVEGVDLAADKDMSRGESILLALRRSRAGQAVAATALAAAEFLSLGTSSAHAANVDQSCVQAALKEPKIVKDGVRHAGQVGQNHNQSIFMTVKYDALPDGCQTDYHRGNTAKAQIFHNGRWVSPSDHGWRGLGGAYDDQGNYIINPPTAFTGQYFDSAGIHDAPWYLKPCRVRILVKENVTHPTQHNNSDSGYHPPDTSNNIAHKIYKVNVSPDNIYPHSFIKNNCN